MSDLDVRAVVSRGGHHLDAVLSAASGQTVAVMGPSGAGKSTLLEAIAGLIRLREGHVRVGGRELSSARRQVPPQRRGIVLLRQDPHLFPHLTARENIAFGLRAHGAAAPQALAAADEWLRRVGLPGAGEHRPRVLSGGQQQRVALARALATEPDVLLLDEPLTALDPATASGVRAMLAEQLPATHTTTVLVTHDAVDAAAIADVLALLEDGRVTQSGPVREVLRAPATAFGAVVAGVNRVVGAVDGGLWRAGGLQLPASDSSAAPHGDVVALFPPAAVALEPLSARSGTAALCGPGSAVSAMGEWIARIERLEQTPAGVRVHTADPAVAVDVTVEAVAAQALLVGRSVRLRVPLSGAVRLLSPER